MFLDITVEYLTEVIAELHRLSESIRRVVIEDLVSPHDRDKVFSVGKIDDVVRISGKHVNRLDPISTDLEFDHFIRADLSFLDQAVAGDDDEELPLGIVPVLSLCDTGLGDVDGELAVIGGFQKLREAAAIVAVHLEIEGDLFLWQI